MATKDDPTRTAVKNLIKADLAVNEAMAKLAYANEQLAQARDVVRQLLPPGAHRFGKWVVNVYEKIHKGRRSPSWKSIAEHIRKGLDTVEASLLTTYDKIYHAPIMEFARTSWQLYDDGERLHTKEPTDTVEVVVELTQAINGGADAQA